MNYQDFKSKYLGKKWDYDGAYGAQCVDLFRFYVKDSLSGNQPKGVAGAADFWVNYETDPNLKNYFDKVPNTPEGVPQAGDVMIWNKKYGPYGHIAIVDSATVDSFTCLSQNDPLGQPTILKSYKYVNVYGWLHPKGNMANELETCMADRAKFWKERDEARAEVEALNTQIGGFKSRITDLSNQLGEAKAEVLNREEQVERLNTEIANGIKLLEERTLQVNQFAREKGELAIQAEQLKVQVETLKQAQTQGELTITLREFIHLLLNQKISIKK